MTYLEDMGDFLENGLKRIRLTKSLPIPSSRENLTPYHRLMRTDPEQREKDDFYPTHPNATRAFTDTRILQSPIAEPCCGTGDMSEVLKEYSSKPIFSSDLISRGYGVGGLDFFSPEYDEIFKSYNLPFNIITNPAFKFAQAFVEKGLRLVKPHGGFVAVLCPLNFLEGEKRNKLLQENLKEVYIFVDRVPFQRGRLVRPNEKGGKMKAYAWYVFMNAPLQYSAKIDWIWFDQEKKKKYLS